MGATIFYLHYSLLASGQSSTGVLLGVVIQEYSDASSSEIGICMMTYTFTQIFMRPLFCSMADRYQNHKWALILSLLVALTSYIPYLVIPFFPKFYGEHPRISWYLMAVSCIIANTALGVAWSLGDALAVNMMQKTGTTYSRMRLMGSLSWGLFGYIIGLINENPYLPKYVAGFLVLYTNVLLDAIALAVWNNDDFTMFDPNISVSTTTTAETEKSELTESDAADGSGTTEKPDAVERLDTAEKPATYKAIKDYSFDTIPAEGCNPRRNLQLVLLKMILREDGRLIKYLLLYTFIGFFLAPMNFLFLSLPGMCQERDCNFSHLAGTLLVTQSVVETISFMIAPWALAYVAKSVALSFALFVILGRFSYYAIFFHIKNIAPYWVNVGEIGHGISFAINYTILVETALLFADKSKFFITELRQMGLVSRPREGNEAKIEADEHKIKTSLRATMQSLFSVVSDGIGAGVGNLVSGTIVNNFSYFPMWVFFSVCAFLVLLYQTIIELLGCRWSDNYEAEPGTKAHEILTLEREQRV